MRKRIDLAAILLLLSLTSQAVLAEEATKQNQFGIGIGAMYAGIGVSYIQNDESRYATAVGAGCSGWSSSSGSLCGVSGSYLYISPNAHHAVHGTALVQKYSEEQNWLVQPSLGYVYSGKGWKSAGSHWGIDWYLNRLF